ncbi:MAG: hypothetical protein FJW90_12160, partial [Actinobacteria bacterium]|nr:hypothetical protein [Actinomycetota bacterium]
MGGLRHFIPCLAIVAALGGTLLAMNESSAGGSVNVVAAPSSSAQGAPAPAAEGASEHADAETGAHDHMAASGEPAGDGGEAGGHRHARLDSAELRRYVGEQMTALDGEQAGLYAVALEDGKQLVTHGPDLDLAGSELATASAEAEPRPPLCADEHAQHVLYGRPAGSPDRYASVIGEIRDEVKRMNGVLNQNSLASGGPQADYRVVCDQAGEVRVDSFVNSGAASFQGVVAAARDAGFDRGDLNYTIFYDGYNGCGIGSLYFDERPIAENRNNRGGGYGISYKGCWRGVPMHENGHNMGAVQYGAPNSTGSGAHCTDEQDIMCYSDGGDRDTGTWQRCTAGENFDCGFDDYFDTAPEPGEYLDRNWNVGSSLNRFLAFDRVLAPGAGGDSGDSDAEVVALEPGVAVRGRTGGARSVRHYSVDVPDGPRTLVVRLDGPGRGERWLRTREVAARTLATSSATPRARKAARRQARRAKRAGAINLDLLLSREGTATPQTTVCAPRRHSNDEVCEVLFPAPGEWSVGVQLRQGGKP